MSNRNAIALALLAVIVNGLVGHFLPPYGIFLTPVIMTITTVLVCFGTNGIKAIWVSALTYFFIAFNDIYIKLYAGGTADSAGLAWIHLFFFIGLVSASVNLLVAIIVRPNENPTSKLIALFVFAGLIAGHWLLFRSLGHG